MCFNRPIIHSRRGGGKDMSPNIEIQTEIAAVTLNIIRERLGKRHPLELESTNSDSINKWTKKVNGATTVYQVKGTDLLITFSNPLLPSKNPNAKPSTIISYPDKLKKLVEGAEEEAEARIEELKKDVATLRELGVDI